MPRNFFVYASFLIIIPIYTWRRFWQAYKKLKNDYKEAALNYERHNCVVMYSKTRGMVGWPPYNEAIKLKVENIPLFMEPFLYFINTAQRSINIAVMVLNTDPVIEALIQSSQRGIKIKVILNYENASPDLQAAKKMSKYGIEVIFYVSLSQDLSSIMHHKYMVKDFDGKNGFLCMGSANLASRNTFLNNFEDVVFTSNAFLVEGFHRDFLYCWKIIKAQNGNLYNRTLLSELDFSER